MKSLTPSSPKSTRWLPLAVVLLLLTGAGLLLYASSATKASSVSATSTPGFYTQAADTLTVLETASTPTQAPSVTPTASPTATSFPQFNFTPQTSLAVATASGANYCDNASYVSDVTIPDGTVMAAGASFVKTWAFQNTGGCTWSTNYSLTFVSGDLMGGVTTNLTGSVAPTQQVQASVALTAPVTAGTYTGYWRLANAQGNGFGGLVFVKIVVSSSTITPTPTTAASTATTAPAATDTSAPASTSTPTSTATPGS
jgi:hypothetical protein